MKPKENPISDDYKTIDDIFKKDSYFHRLLMIEIIKDTKEEDGETNDTITYNKMNDGFKLLGKIFVKYFGVNISQKISILLQKRNEILRDYYKEMKNIVCNGKVCSSKVDRNMVINTNDSIFTPSLQLDNAYINTQRNLEELNKEITDNIATLFYIRDIDPNTNKGPVIHYQRLFNVLSLYDKELIHQARTYAYKQYDISINYSQSSFDITEHIVGELTILISETQQKNVVRPSY